MNIFEWIESALHPVTCSSVEFMYDDMDSQSGYCLPVIYKPFDAADRAHWRDRGSCFDFLYATKAEGKKVLDFGPGDGWPSLIMAPYVREVVGVDASRRRVEVCTNNATRLGISNATFRHVEPGKALPFEDETFDSIIAASSIEQTPDPFFTLQELRRVLKKDGRVRIDYEGLNQYRSGRDVEVYFDDSESGGSFLILYERMIDQEKVHMYKISFTLTCAALKRYLSGTDRTPGFKEVTNEKLQALGDSVRGSYKCSLTHPSGRTLVTWLGEIGFREILPTCSGAWFAGQLYDVVPSADRPVDMQSVDDLIRPIIQIVVNMAAPVSRDPVITAVK